MKNKKLFFICLLLMTAVIFYFCGKDNPYDFYTSSITLSSITSTTSTSTSSSSSTSLTTQFTFGQPIGIIISPAANSCTPSNSLSISGTSSDIDGSVLSINLQVDNVAIAVNGTTNWNGTATLLTNGGHSISLIVYDNSGSASNPDTINIFTDDEQLIIYIINPTNGQSIEETSSLILSGSLSNPDTCCPNKTIQYSIDGTTTWTNIAFASETWTNTPINGTSIGYGYHSVIVKIMNDCGMTFTASERDLSITSKGIIWVNVPGGNFLMGDSLAGSCVSRPADCPAHTVNLTDFWMSETEITVAQYTAFLNDVERFSTDVDGTNTSARFNINMSNYPGYTGIERLGTSGNYSYAVMGTRGDNPINYVTLTNACDFCNWINGTLPSEAQWEYAAGGPNHYIWSLDDTFTNSYCFGGTIRSEKYYPKNGYDLYAMSGGMDEWTLDKFSNDSSPVLSGSSYYNYCLSLIGSSGIPINPVNTYNSSSDCTIRGGNWNTNDQIDLRCSSRGGFHPASRSNTNGFRCVR